MKELRIGNLTLDNPFFLAPLAGITDAPMRRLCKEQGAALVFSEMVSGKGLWYKDKNTAGLLRTYEEERPVAFQIFGHEPEIIAFTASEISKLPCAAIDINMGCPVPKIVKNGEGSALLKNPDLVYDIVSAAVKNTDKPVTVKIRTGWDKNSINAVEVAHAISAAGASAITVHGRTREQYYSGKADWKMIAAVKRAVDIPVVGNGDVVDAASAMAMIEETGCDFVMIGRGALGNPWIFRELEAAWRGKELPEKPGSEEKKEMMIRHLLDLAEFKGEYPAVREMRKHVGWYIKGMHNAAALRGKVNQINDIDELKEAIRSI
ncbi:MAG: tRNA dihydrouridine synthase DusB [Clostridiales bacterium]|nr:tRNA dihydrouridine synthase DusB [Bacillota bacterium]MEE0516350.1 tRNA dihydrouridine synthase DusB [Anaerovoracaceae bacterium]PWL92946.1 MAG: tRNA dihydrouridine synthase DusB [Clostridiales bacterium]